MQTLRSSTLSTNLYASQKADTRARLYLQRGLDRAVAYLIRDNRANIKEILFRTGYVFALNADLNLITAASLDTYNHNLIYGADFRAEWRKMVSFIAGADRYKYHGGLLLDIKPFSLGYTYGLNYKDAIDYVPAHQISVFSNIALSR